MPFIPWRLFLVAISGWTNRQQQVIQRPHEKTLHDRSGRRGRFGSATPGSAAILLGAVLVLFLSAGLQADPQPGDVYREYLFAKRFSEIDPNSKRKGEGIPQMLAQAGKERPLEIGSLHGAVKAEVSIQYWGGHIGTANQKFRVNGNDWILIPQPQGTPTAPQCYYRTLFGRPAVAVPLSQLMAGTNSFVFTCGPQIKYSFDWGFYWVYAFATCVYLDPNRIERASAVLVPPEANVLAENPALSVKIDKAPVAIDHVDFVGEFRDFDRSGVGVSRQWHYGYDRGQMVFHIGTATQPPWTVRWDTTWLPDQKDPVRIMARVVDKSGLCVMTPAIECRFVRQGRSVRMMEAQAVPENFGVRVKNWKTCKFEVPASLAAGGALGPPRRARILVSTWSAAHAEEIGLNGRKLVDRVGKVHDWSLDWIEVPPSLLRAGDNVFHVYSGTEEHAAEVNWPGPALYLELDLPPATRPATAPSTSASL